MAKTVNLDEAKTHLSDLVERAAAGEEVVIAKAGKPRARLVAIEERRPPRRRPGRGKGKVWIAANFDDPDWLKGRVANMADPTWRLLELSTSYGCELLALAHGSVEVVRLP